MPKINSSFTTVVRNPRGAALPEYLALRFPYHGPEEWRNLIALGRLALDGNPASLESQPREGQQLRFAVVDYDEPEVPIGFKLVDRRGDLCFVHKPAGLPMHRTGKIFFQTLANLFRESMGDMAWSPLNRLDRETGGLVAFARGPEAFRAFAPASPDTAWLKCYLAVARGTLPSPQGFFDGPLTERPGEPIRSRMLVLPEGKPALTLYHTIAARDGYSLVALSPITGRKHQLRAHLAEAGCPVVGDKIYSLEGRTYLKRIAQELDEDDFRELGASHHLLHAFYLRLEPRDGAGMEAWDWDLDGEFTRYFGPALAQAWCASPGFGAFRDRIRALRRPG